MTTETVLLYNIKGTSIAAALKPVLLKLKIRVKTVDPSLYGKPIGSLLGKSDPTDAKEEHSAENSEAKNNPLTEPMMVLSGFSNARLDLFLREMRAAKVPSIPLKAVVTSQNQTWDSFHLYEELKAEHAAMHAKPASPSAQS
ncbi:MAG: DUF3783 domain-containing protein [Fusicatenibacter sp.]|nr:DUF3783 domain-containing protein [Lachnospiraceae bacterium]MDY2937183.1 DUF3783 domain-containing protein [Fusicatenibacter sp.]